MSARPNRIGLEGLRRRALSRLLLSAGAVAAAWSMAPLGGPAAAHAQPAGGFPSREIRLIVPWNAGGANDIAARHLQQIAAKDGVRIVVENVPGATGTIGMTKVAAAEADGYTVGMGTSSTLAMIAQKLTPLRNDQFTPIARVSTDPLVLLVHQGSPAKDLDGFIDHLRKNPGKVTIGSPGTNNLNHIFSVMSGRAAGTDTVTVPYPGGAKVVADLAGKQIDAAVLKPSESKGQIDAGLVKPIAVYGNERLAVYPDVPTFKEKGYDVFPYGPLVQMAYVVAPAGVPAPVRDRLIAIVGKAINSAEFRKLADDNGFVVDDLTGSALGKVIDDVQASLNEVGSKVFTQKSSQ